MKTPRELVDELWKQWAAGAFDQSAVWFKFQLAIEQRDAEARAERPLLVPEDEETVREAAIAFVKQQPRSADARLNPAAVARGMRAAIRAINKLRTP